MNRTKELSVSVLAFFAALILGFILIGTVNRFTFSVLHPFAAQYALMPDAAGFSLLYDSSAKENELQEVPATVRTIYAETDGLGFIIRSSTTQGFTGNPMELTVVIDANGRITLAQVDTYPDTNDFGQEIYPRSFIGQDASLAEVELVSGCTFSSSAFKNAVADAFEALIANGLIADDNTEGRNNG